MNFGSIYLDCAITYLEIVEMSHYYAHHEREAWRRRMSAGVEKLVQKGGFPCRLSFGYRLGAKRGFPEICPIEGPAVKRGVRLLTENSIAATAKQLASEGFETRSGGPITPDIVRGMVTNPMVAGVIKYKDLAAPAEHLRIVPNALWNAARKAMRARKLRDHDA